MDEVDAFLVIPAPLDNVPPIPKLGEIYFDRRDAFNKSIGKSLFSGAPHAVYSVQLHVVERLA